MRGDDERSGHLFSYLSPEHSVPADHPLRTIRTMTDALRRLSPRFEAIYATTGRPSIPPEHLLRALLLQVLYSVRSERTLMEQLQYNLLFRWFVGARHGRRRLGVDNLHEESGSAAGGRHRGRVLAVAIRMQQNSFRRKFEDYIRRHPKAWIDGGKGTRRWRPRWPASRTPWSPPAPSLAASRKRRDQAGRSLRQRPSRRMRSRRACSDFPPGVRRSVKCCQGRPARLPDPV